MGKLFSSNLIEWKDPLSIFPSKPTVKVGIGSDIASVFTLKKTAVTFIYSVPAQSL